MDRCHRHPEETRPTSRDSQGVNKVNIWMNTFLSGFLMFSPHNRSESWVFSMYNGECYDLIRQLANLGMRKLISEDSYHQVLVKTEKTLKSSERPNSFGSSASILPTRTLTCC